MDHHTPVFVLVPIGIGEPRKQRMMGTYAQLRHEELRYEVGLEKVFIARLRNLLTMARRAVLVMIRNA